MRFYLSVYLYIYIIYINGQQMFAIMIPICLGAICQTKNLNKPRPLFPFLFPSLLIGRLVSDLPLSLQQCQYYGSTTLCHKIWTNLVVRHQKWPRPQWEKQNHPLIIKNDSKLNNTSLNCHHYIWRSQICHQSIWRKPYQSMVGSSEMVSSDPHLLAWL